MFAYPSTSAFPPSGNVGFARLIGGLSGAVSVGVMVAVLVITGTSGSSQAKDGLDMSSPVFKAAMTVVMRDKAVDANASFNAGAQ
jgi:hypothetical protein